MKNIFLLVVALATLSQRANACKCSSHYNGVESIEALSPYAFVALVKVTADVRSKEKPGIDSSTTGILKIQVIEQFKGEKADQLVETLRNTSCDMGFDEGEEWLVFAHREGDQLVLHPCDRNVIYREKNGFRDWQFRRGMRELDDLRRLYAVKPQPLADGLHQEFFPGGRLELEETIVNGKKNGERKLYYITGKLRGIEHYANDTLNGRSVWCFTSGATQLVQYFRKGKLTNVSRAYYETAAISNSPEAAAPIRTMHESIYDAQGRSIAEREYSIGGVITRESLRDPDRNSATYIFYHPNGTMASISHEVGEQPHGHYQAYDENGNETKSWDYDENGRQINVLIPK